MVPICQLSRNEKCFRCESSICIHVHTRSKTGHLFVYVLAVYIFTGLESVGTSMQSNAQWYEMQMGSLPSYPSCAVKIQAMLCTGSKLLWVFWIYLQLNSVKCIQPYSRMPLMSACICFLWQWAASGECQRNQDYMIGTPGTEPQVCMLGDIPSDTIFNLLQVAGHRRVVHYGEL